MTERPPFLLLREPAWTIVRRRVEALGARDRRMRHAGELLLRPLRLLESLGADTPGALSDDALAAERLRHILYLASPWSALVDEAEKLMKGSADTEAEPPPPGILDLALLVIVGLAAARVAPTRKLGDVFLRTVHGLALSAAPAEMLGRLGPHAHEGPALSEVVNLMVLPDAARLTENRLFLPRFALDPTERGRWSCLNRFFTGGLARALDSSWSEWLLHPRPDAIEKVEPQDAKPGAEITLAGHFPSLADGRWPAGLSVFFYSASGAPLPAKVRRFDARRIVVRVPAGSRGGWVGLPDRDGLLAHNRVRGRLRRDVIAFSSPDEGVPGRACLKNPVPAAEWLRDLTFPQMVLRTAHNGYAGDTPVPGPPAPKRREFPLVVYRPFVLAPRPGAVGDEDLEHTVLSLRDAGWPVVLRDMPWVPDELAVLSTPLTSPDDPRILFLLEAMARVALVTPGLEDALHVVLAPGDGGLVVQTRAEAAAGVAVTTTAGLGEALAKTFPRRDEKPRREATNRLRLLARWASSGGVLLEGVREEERRAAGPGAPYETGLEAVAFDAHRLEMHRSPVFCFRKTRPAPLDLLVPISPEVATVEIQGRGLVLHRIERVPEPPELTKVRLQNATLRFRYRHASGAPARIGLEVGRGGVFTPFVPLDASREEARVPLHRLAATFSLRLVAGDGWNATHERIEVHERTHSAVVARQATQGQWWADVPPSWRVRWTFGKRMSTDRVFRLDKGATGCLRLTARDPRTGVRQTDERRIGGASCE